LLRRRPSWTTSCPRPRACARHRPVVRTSGLGVCVHLHLPARAIVVGGQVFCAAVVRTAREARLLECVACAYGLTPRGGGGGWGFRTLRDSPWQASMALLGELVKAWGAQVRTATALRWCMGPLLLFPTMCGRAVCRPFDRMRRGSPLMHLCVCLCVCVRACVCACACARAVCQLRLNKTALGTMLGQGDNRSGSFLSSGDRRVATALVVFACIEVGPAACP
jgi:hypothetical protein